ncbi:hypothetical protein AYI70_g11816, partial [Smittium culicis]
MRGILAALVEDPDPQRAHIARNDADAGLELVFADDVRAAAPARVGERHRSAIELHSVEIDVAADYARIGRLPLRIVVRRAELSVAQSLVRLVDLLERRRATATAADTRRSFAHILVGMQLFTAPPNDQNSHLLYYTLVKG